MASNGAGTSGVMPHIGPMRDPPSESSASTQATRSSAVSYQKPRSSLSPAQVYINKENLAGDATNSQIAALGEQLNILIALSEKNTRWQKKVTKVLVEVATKLDVPTDGLESEDEDPDDDLA